jgi:microcystin-dependent protein
MASTSAGNVNVPQGNLLASFKDGFGSYSAGGTTTLSPSTVTSTGGGVAHENRQPYLCINFMICTVGVYPS